MRVRSAATVALATVLILCGCETFQPNFTPGVHWVPVRSDETYRSVSHSITMRSDRVGVPSIYYVGADRRM